MSDNKKYNLKEDKKSKLDSLNRELENKEKNLKNLESTKSLKQIELRSDTVAKSKASQATPGSEAKEVNSQILTKKIPALQNYIQQQLTPQITQAQQDVKNTKELINIEKSQPETEEAEETEKEETMKENKLINFSQFKSIVENYTKVNLSESDIINILVETQNPVMTKAELIESLQNKLIIEADMNREVSGSFESGNNEYSELLGQDLARQMANQSFTEIARNIQRKTGKQRVTLDDVQNLLMTSLIDAAKKEYAYGTERLQQKAVDLVSRKFNVPSGSVEFEVEITGLPVQLAPAVAQMSNLNRQQIMSVMQLAQNPTPQNLSQLSELLGVKFGNINKEGLKMSKGSTPPPQGKTAEQMKPKVKRRRFTNAMMQGAARKTQNLHFEDDQFREENPELSGQYGNIMAANDASYWMMDDNLIRQQGESGIHAGNSRIKLSTTGGAPKIIAQGMVYPILLHELGKAIPELMSLWSLPKDVEERKYVLDQTDNLEAETNDIRLGPVLWDKFVEQIPVDNQEVISLTWHMLQELDDYEFNGIVEGLLNNSTNAQRRVQELAEEAMDELRNESSDDSLGVYSGDEDEEGDVATPEEDGEEEGGYSDPELKRILGGQQGEEGPEEPKDLDDMSNQELQGLMQSAVEDEDYVFASQIRDILNSRR
jgi:hypothetical protein